MTWDAHGSGRATQLGIKQQVRYGMEACMGI